MSTSKNTTTNYRGKKRQKSDLRKITEETISQIYDLSSSPEYQHGTGCKCHKNAFSKNKCQTGNPILTKIGKKLKIDSGTVNMYLNEERREVLNERAVNYHRSDKGKLTDKRYGESDDGKGTQQRADQIQYYERGKKKKMGDYRQTDKAKIMIEKSVKKFKKSQKGIELEATWHFIRDSSLMIHDLNLKKLEVSVGRWVNYFNDVFDAGIVYSKQDQSEKSRENREIRQFVYCSSITPAHLNLTLLESSKRAYIKLFNSAVDAQIEE